MSKFDALLYSTHKFAQLAINPESMDSEMEYTYKPKALFPNTVSKQEALDLINQISNNESLSKHNRNEVNKDDAKILKKLLENFEETKASDKIQKKKNDAERASRMCDVALKMVSELEMIQHKFLTKALKGGTNVDFALDQFNSYKKKVKKIVNQLEQSY